MQFAEHAYLSRSGNGVENIIYNINLENSYDKTQSDYHYYHYRLVQVLNQIG